MVAGWQMKAFSLHTSPSTLPFRIWLGSKLYLRNQMECNELFDENRANSLVKRRKRGGKETSTKLYIRLAIKYTTCTNTYTLGLCAVRQRATADQALDDCADSGQRNPSSGGGELD